MLLVVVVVVVVVLLLLLPLSSLLFLIFVCPKTGNKYFPLFPVRNNEIEIEVNLFLQR